MTGTRFDWTEDQKQLLAGWWDQGFTASEIAFRFGHRITRNAVMGKAHRMGLKPRKDSQIPKWADKPKVKKKRSRGTPIVASKLVPIQLVVDSSAPPKGRLVPFMSMNYRTCRSVEGHETVKGHRLAMYCPNPKDPVESFCPYHKKIYYRKDHR